MNNKLQRNVFLSQTTETLGLFLKIGHYAKIFANSLHMYNLLNLKSGENFKKYVGLLLIVSRCVIS